MKDTVDEAKLLTARRVRLGEMDMPNGSLRRILSNTVKRLLLTTRICLLSPSRM